MSISREQYESEMQLLHDVLVSQAHVEAFEINNQVDDILKYRSKKLSAQEVADGLISVDIAPLNDSEKNAFGSEIEFEGKQYLNLGDIWILLEDVFPISSEGDFHLAGDIVSGKVNLPDGIRLPTEKELKYQILSRGIQSDLGGKYPHTFGDTGYFYPSVTHHGGYGENGYIGWHPEHGGNTFSINNEPILTNGGTFIDIQGKTPKVMKVLLVRDNPLQ